MLGGFMVGALDGVLLYHNSPLLHLHGFSSALAMAGMTTYDFCSIETAQEQSRESDFYIENKDKDFLVPDGRLYSELSREEQQRFRNRTITKNVISKNYLSRYDGVQQLGLPATAIGVGMYVGHTLAQHIDSLT